MKSPRLNPEVLQWVGLFAAPLAWTVQLVFGYGFAVGACNTLTRRPDVPLVSWEIAITAAAAAVAVAGQAAAFLAFLATREHGHEDLPPAGRIHFFAVVALLANTIFIVMILLGGITAAHLGSCRQA
jgi:hypothetical protein